MSGGVEGLFLVISHTFPIYKQLSTQGTITSCSLNKLDVKNHWVLRDLENPQALSSALAALRRYSPEPSSFLNPVEPWFLTSNYYLVLGYIITRARSHTTKYIHQHDNPLVRLCTQLGGEGTVKITMVPDQLMAQ